MGIPATFVLEGMALPFAGRSMRAVALSEMAAAPPLAEELRQVQNVFRTPLEGDAELLLQELERDDPLRADIEEINRAARRAMELIKEWSTADGEKA